MVVPVSESAVLLFEHCIVGGVGPLVVLVEIRGGITGDMGEI